MKQIPLPYFTKRESTIKMIVLHCTALDLDTAIKTYNEYQVSPHYIIDTDGTLIQCVQDEHRALHAGTSSWREITSDVNSHSIGIELLHDNLGQTPYSQEQINTLISLCQEIISKYNIDKKYIVGHSDIAPERKSDPGKLFPWQQLANNGIGLWYNKNNDITASQLDIKKKLETIGYDTSNITAASYAFCRRFMPEIIPTIPVAELLDAPYKTTFNVDGNKEFSQTLKAVYDTYINN